MSGDDALRLATAIDRLTAAVELLTKQMGKGSPPPTRVDPVAEDGAILLSVADLEQRWKQYGITNRQIWRMHRRKIIRASKLRKRPLLFPLSEVIGAERSFR